MIERLLEYWLDNVNERAYQAAFCQLLAAQGYKILHSTRHTPMELGKDVIAIAPDGIPCAFQLKGNPGSHLTLKQYREIEPQLHELVTLPIVYPGLPKKPHRSYVVTNGMVDEHVHRAIDDFNRRIAKMGFAKRTHLQIISRGNLFDWLVKFGSSIWPIEISPMNALLEILVSDGSGLFPLQKLDSVLKGILGVETQKTIKSAGFLRQRIFSAAVMTAITLTNFEQKDNHFAIISAWTLFVSYVHAACDRYGYSYKGGEISILIARRTIYNSLFGIFNEIHNRIGQLKQHETDADKVELYHMSLIEGGLMSDFISLPGRTVLVTGLLSLFWFWCEDEGWPDDKTKYVFDEIIPVPMKGLFFWGEAALPQILIHFWHWRQIDSTQEPNYAIGKLLEQILVQSTDSSGKGIASPYYNYNDVIRHIYGRILSRLPDRMERESFLYSSFTAEGLLHLLVRTNLKSRCKMLWPDFSKLMGMEFLPKERWQFCLLRSKEGKNISRQYASTKQWNDLKNDARHISCKAIPDSMLKDKYFLMLFAIIFPHRFTPSLIRHLGFRFSDVWFLEKPIG